MENSRSLLKKVIMGAHFAGSSSTWQENGGSAQNEGVILAVLREGRQGMKTIWNLLARLWELLHGEADPDLSGARARFVGQIRKVKGGRS